MKFTQFLKLNEAEISKANEIDIIKDALDTGTSIYDLQKFKIKDVGKLVKSYEVQYGVKVPSDINRKILSVISDSDFLNLNDFEDYI